MKKLKASVRASRRFVNFQLEASGLSESSQVQGHLCMLAHPFLYKFIFLSLSSQWIFLPTFHTVVLLSVMWKIGDIMLARVGLCLSTIYVTTVH